MRAASMRAVENLTRRLAAKRSARARAGEKAVVHSHYHFYRSLRSRSAALSNAYLTVPRDGSTRARARIALRTELQRKTRGVKSADLSKSFFASIASPLLVPIAIFIFLVPVVVKALLHGAGRRIFRSRTSAEIVLSVPRGNLLETCAKANNVPTRGEVIIIIIIL